MRLGSPLAFAVVAAGKSPLTFAVIAGRKGGMSSLTSTASDAERFVTKDTSKGAMRRPPPKFRDRVGTENYPAEAGRYRLYVSYACPWAHRTLICRALKGLEDAIPVTFTGYKLDHLKESFDPALSYMYKGWDFTGDEPHGFTHLDELYEHASPGYRETFVPPERPAFTVPVLFDDKTQTIVNTESADICDMLNCEFNDFAKNLDLAHKDMDKWNAIIYPHINDGVYRCGFARSQEAYDKAYDDHWTAMDKVEARLGESKYLCGDTLSLADIRLFPTLLRYDAVYYAHFKTSRNKISELPNLYRFLKDFISLPGVRPTCNLDYIKKHYFGSHTIINPTGIVPKGPDLEDLGLS